MLLHEFLDRSAARLPDKAALICQGAPVTYAELDARVRIIAASLAERGPCALA